MEHNLATSDDEEIQGFTAAGAPVPASSTAEQRRHSGPVRTRRAFLESGIAFVPQEVKPASRRGNLRPRANTDPLACVLEGEVLLNQPSFEWDNFGEGIASPSAAKPRTSSRRWSNSTQFSVPYSQPSAGTSSSEGDEFCSPDSEDDSSDETVNPDGDSERTEADSVMDAAAWRRRAEKAIMEANEDVLPFSGKKATSSYLSRLSKAATDLKKELQMAHLELSADPAYLADIADRAAASRTALTGFIVDTEAAMAEMEELSAKSKAEATAASAASSEGAASMRRPLVSRRVAAAADELKTVCKTFQRLSATSPTTDEELFEIMEKVKAVESQQTAAAQEAKDVARSAMDNGLLVESGTLDEWMAEARKARSSTAAQVLEWRKKAGVWSSDKRRAVRSDLKLPTYTAGVNAKTTIYEFEKDWKEYSQAMDYSKEESLKVLKQAILQPTKSDIINLLSVDEIFKYLKKHHGNPMMLLHAKEKDVRSWGNCKGGDMSQRDWLVQAKSKLEGIVTMCKEHGIEKYLHFSTVAGDVQSKLPSDLIKDFKKILKEHLSPSGVLEKELIIGLLIEFIEDKILDCTLGVNLDIVNYLGTNREEATSVSNDAHRQFGGNNSGRQRNQQQRSNFAINQQPTDGGPPPKLQVDDKCLNCSGNHTHLFYCEWFITANLQTRFEQVRKQKACARCLGMKVKLTGRRDDWHPLHEKFCKTKFACKEGQCGGRAAAAQFHITLCRYHPKENKQLEYDFIRTLDVAKLPSNCLPNTLTFLTMGVWLTQQQNPTGGSNFPHQVNQDGEVYDVIPDVNEAAVFMMQAIPAAGQRLLAFYDSGCSGAGISDRAFYLLNTKSVRKGPTVLDVAGGTRLEIPYGDEQFTVQLEKNRQLATITALRMPNVTSEFPLLHLQQAWDDLAAAASGQQVGKLPTVDKTIGGSAVDLIVGIKYLKYFPQLVFSLPSGLAIYRAQFKSFSSHQAVLGGPHSAWAAAAETAGHMNPRAYFTAEARAWCVQESWVRINQNKYSEVMDLQEDNVSCCQEEFNMYKMTTSKEDREFQNAEDVGAESPYRCAGCRNCQNCKRGDEMEAVSFREEAEQALIEASIELDASQNKLTASLPFIENPATSLHPNRFVAESVFRSQLALFKKRPDMKEDTVRSHDKLVQRGYVKREDQLTQEEKEKMNHISGDGYFIPWRIVHNEGSISTPCRLVFDASSKTPGGNSLNGILAKGKNRLVKLQSLLARFRLGKSAVTADISMAYNGTWLRPEYLKFQRYLWKEELDESRPTIVMFILTLIYGVKPSGGQCQASIEKLADFFKKQKLHLEAAEVLEKDVYVDDVISSSSSVEECYVTACGIEEILKKGSMQVKAFSFSGQPPPPEVTADGQHVGLAGYLWRPLEDDIKLDVGPPRLGKAKRGKLPDPIVGDFGAALKKNFTRRILAGMVARVFDPLGLATPITANLKLDLHQLCTRKLDWDDDVPLDLLDLWVANMASIQELRDVTFSRTIIPEDAATDTVDLLVAVDASQCLGVAAIYGRVKRKCGLYSCQLVMARSKIVSNLTIPRAEMRSAVMGAVSSQVVKRNLGSRLGEVIMITDSTICLHWIHQDDRPLQVAVRNAVIEIRRFSKVEEWLHVDSGDNIADLATRTATVSEVASGSAWQNGYSWMTQPKEKMPLKTAAEIVLTAEEKRAAAAETRAKDIHGHTIAVVVDKMAARYSHSNYILDPCRFSWSKAVRVLALVFRFIKKLKTKLRSSTGGHIIDVGDSLAASGGHHLDPVIKPEELQVAETYYFRKATAEVLQFTAPRDYKDCTVLRDGILYFTGRILDCQKIHAFETAMFDLNPLSFCRPVVDRFSPIAYSIMVHTHWAEINHLNAIRTYRESLNQAYIIRGRDLAQEVRSSCVFCRRFKAKLCEVEMGKMHETRFVIAPPFTICQVDLMGPYQAQCEHNHRSTVKVWGAIFKDPASGAVYVHAMSKCDTSAFILAYTRFSARFCHPQKLYPDEGSQLLLACKQMELSWVDVAHTLNAQHGVGVEFHPCPVGGHNVHGSVERSILEIKKLFNTVYSGLKLDILGYETAFGWISNELNNLPFCIGSRYKDLEHLDLLTPNRLIHGRANKRALSGCCMAGAPSLMLARMEEVFQAWWRAWQEEKLVDFVGKPAKWFRSDPALREGDIVVFLKTGDEQSLGEPIWRIGRIVEVEISARDQLVRTVSIEYKNATENKFRTTRRAVRKVAVLHREDELEMVQEINAAARAADKLELNQTIYLDQQSAVFRDVKKCQGCREPCLCAKHNLFFVRKPFIVVLENMSSHSTDNVVEQECFDQVCQKFKIHSDPWA